MPGTFFGNRFEIKDGPQLDSFGNHKVAFGKTLFDAQQEYGLDTLRLWEITANGTLPTVRETNGSVSSGGNSVGPTNSNTRATPITVSSTNGHYAVLQSQQYVRYIPGHAHEIQITGVFAAGSGATAAIRLRTSTSGSVVDTDIAQASWSVDPFDGSGPSGITLDFTAEQILVIDAQMLYAGRVRVGFDVDGKVYWAHYFLIANNQTVPTMQTFNLPVRLEGRTGASSTSFAVGYFDAANGVALVTTRSTTGGTIQFNCCSVKSSGGEELRGFPHAAGMGTSTTTVTTRRPVFSIRPRAQFNGRTNRGHVEPIDFKMRATTNDGYYEIVRGGTLTGAAWAPVGVPIAAGSFVSGVRYVILTVGTTDFTLIGAASNTVGVSFVASGVGAGTGTAVLEASITEHDFTATAIAGGEVIDSGYLYTGVGAASSPSGGELDLRSPLVMTAIDALTAFQVPITIVVTSMTGNCIVSASSSWHEQTV